MTADEYIAYQAAGRKWGLQFMGRALAVFPSKAQAIRAAVSVAHANATPDRPAVVFSESSDGEFYPIWSSDKDGFANFTRFAA